jgi:hypothetical protein
MQPILAADSFRLNSGSFQVQSVNAVSPDAAKSADDLVMPERKIIFFRRIKLWKNPAL